MNVELDLIIVGRWEDDDLSEYCEYLQNHSNKYKQTITLTYSVFLDNRKTAAGILDFTPE